MVAGQEIDLLLDEIDLLIAEAEDELGRDLTAEERDSLIDEYLAGLDEEEEAEPTTEGAGPYHVKPYGNKFAIFSAAGVIVAFAATQAEANAKAKTLTDKGYTPSWLPDLPNLLGDSVNRLSDQLGKVILEQGERLQGQIDALAGKLAESPKAPPKTCRTEKFERDEMGLVKLRVVTEDQGEGAA